MSQIRKVQYEEKEQQISSLLQSLKQDAAFSGDFATNSKVFSKVLRKNNRFWECFGTLTKMN